MEINSELWLSGPMRFALSPDIRAIYVDLLALASRNGGSVVSAGELGGQSIPYPMATLAALLNVEQEGLETAIESLQKFGYLQADVADGNVTIRLTDTKAKRTRRG